MRRIFFPLVIPLLLVACTHDLDVDKITTSQILLGSTLNEREEITEDRTVFVPTEETFHAHAFIEGLAQETEVIAAWWYGPSATLGGEEQKIYETRVKATPDLPVAKFFLTNVRGWPPGQYRFSVSSGGEEIGGREFTVEE